jgi:hypothetical protein
MRKSLLLVGAAIAVALVAIGLVTNNHSRTKSNATVADDLQQARAAGLDLAQSQTARKYPLTEISEPTAPVQAKKLKRSAESKVISSTQPAADAASDMAPVELEAMPHTQIIQAAVPTPAAPTASALAPQRTSNSEPNRGPIVAAASDHPVHGTGQGNGSTIGGDANGVMGTRLGSIFRGGVVDGDHCDPRTIYGGRPQSPVFGGGIGSIVGRPRGP